MALADQVDTAWATVPEAVNAKDRHVVAAALAGDARFVVTEDTRLRTEVAAAGLGVEPLDGDAFAMRLWAAAPVRVDQTIRQLIAKRRRRPVSESEMAAQLAAHFPAMTAAWLERPKR